MASSSSKKLSQDFFKKFAVKEARKAMKEMFKESVRVPKQPPIYPITSDASSVFNRSLASHKELLQDVWSYIKQQKLQDPRNKRHYLCDDKLKNLFGVDHFSFTDVPRLTSQLILKPAPAPEELEAAELEAPLAEKDDA